MKVPRVLAATSLACLALLVNSSLAGSGREKVNKKKLERALDHFTRGRALDDTGRPDEAVREYREALRDDPEEPYWFAALGDTLAKQGHSQEAGEAYARASQLSPDDSSLQAKLQKLQNGSPVRGTQKTGSAAQDRAPTSKETGEPPLIRNTRGAIIPPRPLYSPDPPYSEKARVVRYQGVILLVLAVDENGDVTGVRDIKPLGMGLDENAIDTVRRWKFQPAMRDGKPIRARVSIEVSFRLK
jgi:TonB family protein